ncbi:MAG: Rne/Rng family ribonuclease [Luteitalea sp.]|nr:Rne/Rng family ribonuclease [Luteitalea sp.]
MNKEMIISSNDHETLVAILEEDEVVELFIERERQRGVVGNIYKGQVSKVLPGLQSAFVDVGLERDGFLYVSDVFNTLDAFERVESSDEETPAVAAADAVPESIEPAPGPPLGEPAWGGTGSVDSNGDEDGPGADAGSGSPAVTNAAAALAAPSGSAQARGDRRRSPDRGSTPNIEDLLNDGQDVLVQVVKEPLGTKGARITSHITVPGRFLVFMPTVDHIGVSRKIEQREERHRLRTIVRQFREATGFAGGVIIRTAAAGRPEADILGDLEYFRQVGGEIRQKVDASRAPALLHREQSLVAKLIRDLLTEEYLAIRLDDATEYRRVLQLVERIMPAMVSRVRLYTGTYPIFDEYGIRNEIDKALRSKVWLKSGGYIVINQTEALVAIDVNTGRYVGKKTTGRLEDTILKTNLEAVREIVRQLRLRDMGGIVVLDFIDMEEKKNRLKVFQALEQELRKDRSPSKAVQVSDFGLIIITRKRVKQSLERLLTDPCPYCSGSGVIKSRSTICFEILNEMRKLASDFDGETIQLRVNPEIARALRDEQPTVLREIEQTLGRQIVLRPDITLHHEQYDVMALWR